MTSAACPALTRSGRVGVRQTLDLEDFGKGLEHEPLEIPRGHRAVPMTQALAAAPEVFGLPSWPRPPNEGFGCSTRWMFAFRCTSRVIVPAGNPVQKVLLVVLERQADAGLESRQRRVGSSPPAFATRSPADAG